MFNLVVLTGRLTADPELRYTPSNIPVTTFSIAVSRRYKAGEQAEADFINIVAWRQTAEFVTKYFQKGSMIAVVGSIQTRRYTDNEGKERTVTEVVVGEKDTDPVLVITDLLPHLGAKQMDQKASMVITGENLDILVGNRPMDKDENGEDVKEAVKELSTKEYVDNLVKGIELPSVEGLDDGFFSAYSDKVSLPEKYLTKRALITIITKMNPVFFNIFFKFSFINKTFLSIFFS